MKLQKIIDIIESIAPTEAACEWDNVGLMIGDVNSDIKSIVISLDFDENSLKTAIKHNANLILTHHPAIFKPLDRITDNLIIETIKNGINVYSAHTNFDCAIGGVNYALADKLEMYNCEQFGMMRVGKIDEDLLKNVIERTKKALSTKGVRFVGDLNRKIRKIAVLGGSGGDFIEEAFSLGCDLLVTGECKYNQAQLAHNIGLCIVEAGHFETEYPAMKNLADALRKRIDIDVIETQPNNVFKTI
ncbi:MAG: Nif3-like dinuclear metal center hexameric protein [Clostridia bacterium]|nr:Nif3-like dinuclear metal center hexameric protein [Clostridia bacterium]